MNEHSADPQGLEDPALLAEIEAEFADLTREIERISAMPSAMAPQKTKLIEALRASWRQKIDTHGDRPEWRQRLDDTIGRAVDRLLESGIQENPDGSLGFALRGDVLQAEGGPLMRGLLDGFVHILEEKFPAPDATKAASDAPANPMAALMGTLGQALTGVLKNALQNAKAPEGGVGDSTVKVGAGDLDMKFTQSDINATSGEANKDMAFAADKKLSATFALNTKVSSREGGEAKTTATATTTGAANAGANAFFQQLMAGVGQALQQATKPGRPPEAKAEPAKAEPAKAAKGPATVDVANIGQTLLAALQRAMGPGTVTATQVSKPGEAKDASTDKPAEGEAKAAGDAKTEATPPAPDAPDAPDAPPKPASLQIDFAGLLQQLLGGKKPPGT